MAANLVVGCMGAMWKDYGILSLSLFTRSQDPASLKGVVFSRNAAPAEEKGTSPWYQKPVFYEQQR